MPANGSANMSRSTSVVAVTGACAHADQLTPTTSAAVVRMTSRLDRVLTTGDSSLERLHRVEGHGERAARAVELAGLDRIDPHELAVLHLHADQALAGLLLADIGRGD